MRTLFASKVHERLPDLLPEYETSVGLIYKMIADAQVNSESDPKKVAKVIVDLSSRRNLPKRLLLGTAAAAFVRQAEAKLTAEAETDSVITDSTI